ncbi:hypothetical protein B4144_3078 [Bacillus atrophaeus]|nr:hypothetical protein B4144_3078 [Bacillus atrophaeus]
MHPITPITIDIAYYNITFLTANVREVIILDNILFIPTELQ